MGRKKILVVDDESYVRRVLVLKLEKTFEVITAVDGQDGLEKAKSDLPDLAVIDIMMPKKSGLELSRELKADPNTQHIPILLLTASAEGACQKEGNEIGVQGYVLKPFSPREILKKICSILNVEADAE